MTQFKGKAIYNPGGKAREYSEWAVNFYNGCSARCEYCYNRKGRSANILGGNKPTLKKSLKDENTAFEIFSRELFKNEHEIRKTGLFFNFVSDPMLPETVILNTRAMRACFMRDIPVKLLTKQTWWVNHFISEYYKYRELLYIGFTLTGHDELERRAATNEERVMAIWKLHNYGFKTWASIEPIIDFPSAQNMIWNVRNHCDLIKVGLQSGKKYDVVEAQTFVEWLTELQQPKIYLKESLQKLTRYTNAELDDYFVESNYLW